MKKVEDIMLIYEHIMYDCTTIQEEIRVGSGKTILATKIGKLKVKIKQTKGMELVVTLSSAEAEWIALSEVAREVLFVAQILK